MEDDVHNEIKNINEDFNYDETVEIIDKENGSVNEGKIVSIRGDLLIVYNKRTKQEEKYHKDDNIIIKLWEPGRPFQIFNRIDIKLTDSDFWVIGMVIDINEEKEQLLIKYTNKEKIKKEEWINIHSERIAQIGLHTSGSSTGNLISADEINKKLFKNRKFITLNKDQEEKIKDNIEKLNFFIKQMGGDGNCMFRAVSDQIYGTDKHNKIIREKCMDYIEKNKIFFSQFIEGGEAKIKSYIERKRKNGIYGDNIEIQALSELYNRPIEIYNSIDKPMKSFSKEDFNKRFPIKISYFNGHYNSIVPSMKHKDYSLYKKELLNSNTPGIYETKFIKNCCAINENVDLDKNLIWHKDEINEDKNKEKYLDNPIIKTALGFGFNLDDSIKAFKVCGNNQDLVIDYLCKYSK